MSFLQALLPYAVDATTSTIDTQFARIVESAPEALVEADEHSVPTDLADGEEAVLAPVSGTVVSLEPHEGELGLIEALKMHHPIVAPPHTDARPLVNVGDTVVKGQPLWIVQGAVSYTHLTLPTTPYV